MKLINILVALMALALMLSPGAYALEQYTGNPESPYVVYGQVLHNSAPASGLRVSLTNVNTGYSEELIVTAEGFYQADAMNWLTTAGGRPPVMYGDQIKIKVLDGCGAGDVCEKIFSAKATPNIAFAKVDFDITGALACPICPSTSCNCGGGSGGSYVIYKATQELCDKDFPCKDTACPEMTYEKCHSEFPCYPDDPDCGECEVCPSQESCQDTICEECVEDNNLGLVLAALAGLIMIIGGGVQVYKNRAGGITMLHRHRGITGYHDMDTQHKNKEYRHVAFSKDPVQFMKDMKKING